MTGKTETSANGGGDTLRDELAAEIARDSERQDNEADGPHASQTRASQTQASKSPAPYSSSGQGGDAQHEAAASGSLRHGSRAASEAASGPAGGDPASGDESGEPASETTSNPATGPTSGAPQSFSPEARAEWDSVPPAVRDAIVKREREVDSGFRRYSGLGQFMKLAQSAGTSLPEALSRYVAAEKLLDADPVSGILTLCQNYNVDPSALASALGAKRASAGAGHANPSQGASGASQAAASQASNPPAAGLAGTLAPLASEMAALQELVLSNQQAQALTEVDSFFNDQQAHPYIAQVAPDMARLLSLGVCHSLQEAYEAACWNNQEVRGRLINAITTARAGDQAARARAAADQARAAGRSITGGPAATPPPGPPDSDDLREQLKAAFASAKLA